MDTGEKVQIGVRISPNLRKLLDQSASQSGRSLSQEAEVRLERSYDPSLAATLKKETQQVQKAIQGRVSVAVRNAVLNATAEFGDKARELAEQMAELKAEIKGELKARLGELTASGTFITKPGKEPKK